MAKDGKMSKKEKTVMIGVAALVVMLFIAGIIGWVLLAKNVANVNQSAGNTETVSRKSDATPEIPAGMFYVKEWNAEFTLPSGMSASDVKYQITTDKTSGDETLALTTKYALKTDPGACALPQFALAFVDKTTSSPAQAVYSQNSLVYTDSNSNPVEYYYGANIGDSDCQTALSGNPKNANEIAQINAEANALMAMTQTIKLLE